jgi:hypothetical protein
MVERPSDEPNHKRSSSPGGFSDDGRCSSSGSSPHSCEDEYNLAGANQRLQLYPYLQAQLSTDTWIASSSAINCMLDQEL